MTETPATLATDPAIASARAVLRREIEGLEALSASLGEPFVRTVALIERTKGRVIVSGMGKSGHVARKIAATFASTGTPAFFVHPAEASHGDLGMIGRDDCVILLSNSGETAELRDIVDYCKRFNIPLVGIVRRPTSQLVDAADIALVLPEVPEAAPVGAPTTSTTMMLALGDMLAVALLEKRGFGQDDFRTFHPGGKLGAGLLRVDHLMHGGDALPVAPETAAMRDALLIMTSKRLGCIALTDTDGKLAGIITDGDLRRAMGPDLLDKPAADVMTRGPITVTRTMLASEALAIMNRMAITNLFVVEDGCPVGALHIHDCLRAGVK